LQQEQYKIFLFWQEQNTKLINDLQEIDRIPLNISFDDNNYCNINKKFIDPIHAMINDIKL